MNYKDAVKVIMTVIVISNRAVSELVAKISEPKYFNMPAVGRDHILYCKVVNSNNVVSYQYRYRWKINNETIIENSRGRFVLNDWTLTVRQITKEDKNMTIQCQVILYSDQSEFSTMVVLNPRYGPSNVSIFPEKKTLTKNVNKRLELQCLADCNPECKYTWLFKSQTSTKATSLGINKKTFEIKMLKPNDTGRFACGAWSPDLDIAKSEETKYGVINLLVNYGPESVSVNPRQHGYNAIEGKSFGPLNCTADCFPMCSYKWRFRSSSSYSYKTIENSAVLNFNVIQRNNTGMYKCVAKNSQLNERDSIVVHINVHYGPTNVSLSRFQQNITVKEGTLLRGIKCSAECKPRCEYRWYKDVRSFISSSQAIFAKAVYEPDMGNYTCYVENRYTGQTKASKSFVLNILHGPKNTRILLANNTTAVAVLKKESGSTIGNLYCSSDCNPGCNYTWTFDNNNFTRHGQVLRLGTATIDKSGTYVCTAKNSHGSKNHFVNLTIEEYGIKLSNSTVFLESPYAVVEGSSLHLHCNAKCKLQHCWYRWYDNKGRFLTHDSNLVIHAVRREKSGTYRCYDTYEKRWETLQLIIQYAPSITYVRSTSQHGKISNNDLEIKKGGALELKCKVDSVPLANITWRKFNNKEILAVVSNMSYLVYSKEESVCEDLGTYTCEAENGIGDIVYNSINVFVRCPPYLTPQKRRKINSTYKKRLGSNVMFTTEVKGYPPVKARWYYKYNHTAEENFINPTENNISSVDGVFSLYIGNITVENFGIYVIKLRNEEGNLSFKFALEQPKTMVLAPDKMGSTNNNRSELGSFIGGVVAGIALLCLVVIALVGILMKKRANSQKELSTEPEGFSSGHFEDDNHHFDTDGVIRTNECGNMAEGTVYDNTTYGLKPNSNIQDSKVKLQRKNSYTYAQVQKRNTGGGPNVSNLEVGGSNSDTYAEVQKQTNTAKPLPISDGQVLENDQEIYANVEENQTKKKPCTGELGNDKPVGKQHRDSGKRTNQKGADRKSKPKQKSQSMNYIDVEFQSPASERSKSIIHGVENRTLYSLVDFTKHAEPLPESEIQDDNVDEPKFKTTEEGSWC